MRLSRRSERELRIGGIRRWGLIEELRSWRDGHGVMLAAGSGTRLHLPNRTDIDKDYVKLPILQVTGFVRCGTRVGNDIAGNIDLSHFILSTDSYHQKLHY